MKTLLLVSVLFSFTFAFNLTQFCSSRPLGLYCDPENDHGKIECPSGTKRECTNGELERCQELGLLKKEGFKGGIARCAPRLNATEVKQFCSTRYSGTYCYPSPVKEDIRIHCPTGMVFKCKNETKCFQNANDTALCETIGETLSSATVCPFNPVLLTKLIRTTFTVTASAETVTVTETMSVSVQATSATPPFQLDNGNFTPIVPHSIHTVFVSLTPAVTQIPTSTSIPKAQGGPPIVLIPTPVATQVPTTTSIPKAAGGQPILVNPPNSFSCPNGQSVTITSPPGASFSYNYISAPQSYAQASAQCKEMGGNLSSIDSTDEHWRLGGLLCVPTWYNNWNTDSYGTCIALYPGGATAVPVGGCEAQLPALCQIMS